MASSSYIPSKDSLARNWFVNFATLITATPAAYGLVAADAVAITAKSNAFDAALTLALDPSTRTAETVQAKNTARIEAESLCREYAQRIQAEPAVTDAQRVALGLTVRAAGPTPIPAPTSRPVLGLDGLQPGSVLLRYTDLENPAGKSKPYGVVGVQVFAIYGLAPAVDPEAAKFVSTVTKSPFVIAHGPADAGKTATYFTRYVTRGGSDGVAKVGPWSNPLSTVVV